MQITSATFLFTLVGIAAAASPASGLRGNGQGVAPRRDYSEFRELRRKRPNNRKIRNARNYGFTQARNEWKEFDYSCNSREDVRSDFAPAVKKYVNPQCKNRYRGRRNRRACREGTAKFVNKKLAECSSHDDCSKVGDAAAGAIAKEFCGMRLRNRGGSSWDRGCIRTGENRCKSKVVDIVNGYARGGQCRRLRRGERLSSGQISFLERECIQEVEALTS